jgi:hypothetical protein
MAIILGNSKYLEIKIKNENIIKRIFSTYSNKFKPFTEKFALFNKYLHYAYTYIYVYSFIVYLSLEMGIHKYFRIFRKLISMSKVHLKIKFGK